MPHSQSNGACNAIAGIYYSYTHPLKLLYWLTKHLKTDADDCTHLRISWNELTKQKGATFFAGPP